MASPHIALTDIGPEILNLVFLKLGPSPKDVATLAYVCRAWRDVLNSATWEALCLAAAPSLCKKAGYGPEKQPPGKFGWLGLYKLITYCPGIKTRWQHPYRHRELREPEYLGLFLGHVETEEPLGFLAGPSLKKDLRLKASCRKDTIFLTRPCQSPHVDSDDDTSEGFPSAARGLIKDFPTSAIARKCGATTYLSQKLSGGPQVGGSGRERVDGGMGKTCTYCEGQLFELPPNDFFDNDWRSEFEGGEEYEFDEDGHDNSGYDISGYVCENGHLILGVFGCLHFAGGFDAKMEESGEDLDIYSSSAIKSVCSAFGPAINSDFETDGIGVVAKLDAVAIGERTRSFVQELMESLLSNFDASVSPIVELRTTLAMWETQFDWFRDDHKKVCLLLGKFAPEAAQEVMKHLVWGASSLVDVMKDVDKQLAIIALKKKRKR